MVRKAHHQPRELTPRDLDPVRTLVGDGALDYALVIGVFHFINRMADLLGVDLELLPGPLRRFEFLRRMAVRAGGRILGRMDLANRPYGRSYEEAVSRLDPVLQCTPGRRAGQELEPLRARPKLVEALQLAIEERDLRSGLDRAVLATVHRTVEEALPASKDVLSRFAPHPSDPVVAFAFVGTRYAYRSPQSGIDALRRAGYDDLGILDLATAVADANCWARLSRLVGLSPRVFHLG